MSLLEEYRKVHDQFEGDGEGEGPLSLSKEDYAWFKANKMYSPVLIELKWGGVPRPRPVVVQAAPRAPVVQAAPRAPVVQAVQGGGGVKMTLLDEYKRLYARFEECVSSCLGKEDYDWLKVNDLRPPEHIEMYAHGIVLPRVYPLPAAVLALFEPPAVQVVPEPEPDPPVVSVEPEPPVVLVEPEPPVVPVEPPPVLVKRPAEKRAPEAPVEQRAPPKKKIRRDTPLFDLLYSTNVHCFTHQRFGNMHPSQTLLVKPAKSERSSFLAHDAFPLGGVDVYWSRKFDGHSVYLVFCTGQRVKAFSATGKALPILKVVDALREAFVPRLEAEEFVIVKAEMCMMVDDGKGKSHEAGHDAVCSTHDPYRRTGLGHEARLVFHCFEVVLVAAGTQFTNLDYFDMDTLSDYKGLAHYSYELSPAQHTQLLRRLLRPTAFVSVVAWEKEGSNVPNQEEYTALKAGVCDKVAENGWEGVVFWVKYAGGFPSDKERLYHRDTSGRPGERSVSILRNTMQFKWKDYVRPVFRLERSTRPLGRNLVSMVCPWTGSELRRVDLDDPLHVNPRFKATLLGHMENRRVLRAKAVKFSSSGTLAGLFQLNERNVGVVSDFDPKREQQASNSHHEILCKENRDLLKFPGWLTIRCSDHPHFHAVPP